MRFPFALSGMLKLAKIIESRAYESPQCVFGCGTGLLPASPRTIWSRGSGAARLVS
jgi:hypothetical protein